MKFHAKNVSMRKPLFRWSEKEQGCAFKALEKMDLENLENVINEELL